MAGDYYFVPGIEGDPRDPADAARCGLLALMLGLSEECWNAVWMHELEFRLWQARPPFVGLGRITERQVTLLHALAEEAGGWWRWGDEEHPTFEPMPRWLGMFAVWEAETARRAKLRGKRGTPA